MKIFCCNCKEDIDARLTDGFEVYPHRRDLGDLPFWKCDSCGGTVGCHHKTKNRTSPLGVIPSDEIKRLRKVIHLKIDPLWKSGKISRGKLYSNLSKVFGRKYHTADIRSVSEANLIINHADALLEELSE